MFQFQLQPLTHTTTLHFFISPFPFSIFNPNNDPGYRHTNITTFFSSGHQTPPTAPQTPTTVSPFPWVTTVATEHHRERREPPLFCFDPKSRAKHTPPVLLRACAATATSTTSELRRPRRSPSRAGQPGAIIADAKLFSSFPCLRSKLPAEPALSRLRRRRTLDDHLRRSRKRASVTLAYLMLYCCSAPPGKSLRILLRSNRYSLPYVHDILGACIHDQHAM